MGSTYQRPGCCRTESPLKVRTGKGGVVALNRACLLADRVQKDNG